MTIRTFRMAIAIVLLAATAMAQSTASDQSVQQRLQKLEDRISAIENRLDQLVPEREAGASSTAADQQKLPDRMDAIDQKLLTLERKQQSDEHTAAAESKKTALAGAGPDGFFLKSADNNFLLNLSGYVHVDGRWFTGDSGHLASNTFLLRRVRPIIQGTVFKYIDYRILPDFGSSAGTVPGTIQDAYIDFRYFNSIGVLAGKAKDPFGLEWLESANNLAFAERALPTRLVPNRDVGIQLHGGLGPAVQYAIAAVNGAVDGGNQDVDTNNGKDFVGRVFATPFTGSDWLRGLGLGLAGSTGSQDGGLPSYKTSGQNIFFRYAPGAAAMGEHFRYSPQLYYYAGPFGLLTEWVQSSQDVQNASGRRMLDNQAWQVTGSYFLTGEKNSYGRVAPKNNFEGPGGGSGAMQLAFRYNALAVDPDAFVRGYADITTSAQNAKAWAVGVNWYLNRFARLMFDYEQTQFHGGATTGDRPTEHLFMNRFQLAF